MQIESGLFDHMVIQRNPRNLSDQPVSGTARDGELYVLVNKRPAQRMGRVKSGRFKFRLTGLRVGGPYAIGLEVRDGKKTIDRIVVRDVCVGDVWIAGGQSNMQGCGKRPFADKPLPEVRAFYMQDQWNVARDPIHNLWDAIDPIHAVIAGRVRCDINTTEGVGPAVAFGQEMFRRTKIPQGILACAHGGTSMQQWDPTRRDEGGNSLYGATIRRLKKNGGRVAGIIWYQGESDANATAAPFYTERMKSLIAAIRRDTAAPRLPFVLVQISRVIGWVPDIGPSWNSVQDQQRKLADQVRQVATVAAIDLTLDDMIHIGGKDNTRLGKRLAQAMLSLTSRSQLPPPRLRRVQVVIDPPRNGAANIVVSYDHVVGRLRSGSRPTGFVLMDNRPVEAIFDVQLKGAQAIIRTNLGVTDLLGKHLSYGQGTNPVCNITDEADRAIPVMDSVPLGKPRAVTPHLRRWEISDLLDGAGKLAEFTPPADANGSTWSVREFAADLADRHLEIEPTAPSDKVVLYRCRFTLAEPMKLAALLGYDGPVKIWHNGNLLFHDPHGTNPAIPERRRVKFTASPGQHEFIIALGTNRGKAWGVTLRLQRLDVPPAALKRGPGHYQLPEFVR